MTAVYLRTTIRHRLQSLDSNGSMRKRGPQMFLAEVVSTSAERTKRSNWAVNTSIDASGPRHTICSMLNRSAYLVAPSLRSAGQYPQ
jgi:hypothetical protein